MRLDYTLLTDYIVDGELKFKVIAMAGKSSSQKDMRQLKADKIKLLEKYQNITPIVKELIVQSNNGAEAWKEEKLPVVSTRLEEFLDLSSKENDKTVTTIAHNPLIEALNLIEAFMKELPQKPEEDKTKRDIIIDMDDILKRLNTELQKA